MNKIKTLLVVFLNEKKVSRTYAVDLYNNGIAKGCSL